MMMSESVSGKLSTRGKLAVGLLAVVSLCGLPALSQSRAAYQGEEKPSLASPAEESLRGEKNYRLALDAFAAQQDSADAANVRRERIRNALRDLAKRLQIESEAEEPNLDVIRKWHAEYGKLLELAGDPRPKAELPPRDRNEGDVAERRPIEMWRAKAAEILERDWQDREAKLENEIVEMKLELAKMQEHLAMEVKEGRLAEEAAKEEIEVATRRTREKYTQLRENLQKEFGERKDVLYRRLSQAQKKELNANAKAEEQAAAAEKKNAEEAAKYKQYRDQIEAERDKESSLAERYAVEQREGLLRMKQESDERLNRVMAIVEKQSAELAALRQMVEALSKHQGAENVPAPK